MVELKNGDTLSGILGASDSFMNVNLRDLVRTSHDGEHFWKINECYVRGNNIKCFRFPDELYNEASAGVAASTQDKKAGTNQSGLNERGRGRNKAQWQPAGRGRGRGLNLSDKHCKFRRTGLGRSATK